MKTMRIFNQLGKSVEFKPDGIYVNGELYMRRKE